MYTMRSTLFFLLICTGLGARESTPSFPLYEDYLANDNGLNHFVKDALAFLHQRGDSPYAPRVAADVFQVAVMVDNKALSHRMMDWLLFDYRKKAIPIPSILKMFEKPDDYRRFLVDSLEARVDAGDSSVDLGFVNAVRCGVQVFGPDFLKDKSFLLKAYCAAHTADDHVLAAAAAGKLMALERQNDDMQKLIDTVMRNRSGSTRDMLVALFSLKTSKRNTYLRYYLLQLPKSERDDQAVVAIRAYLALCADEYQETIELLGSLDELNAQHLYWKMAALWGTDRIDDALKTIETLKAKHAKSPWSATAARLSPVVAASKKNKKIVSDKIYDSLMTGRYDFEALRVQLVLHPDKKGDPSKQVYLFINLTTGQFHIGLYCDGKLELAYQNNMGHALLFKGNAATIIKIKSKIAGVPVPRFDIQRNDNGTFNFNYNMSLGSMDMFRKQGRGLFESEHMQTAAAFYEIIEYTIWRNIVLPEIVRDPASGNISKVILHNVQFLEPEEELYVFDFARNRFTGFTGKSFSVTDIAYGKSDAVRGAFPKWPELPVNEVEDGGMIMMDVWMAAMKFFVE